MKRLLIFAATMFAVCSCCGTHTQKANSLEKITAELNDPSSKYVLVAAHRGDWRGFPENSIEALESAIAMGVDIVELDVQMTADSVLILMHDSTLDRTTTGKGKVSEWTFDSLRSLSLRNGCAIRTKHRIPTLEEALLKAKDRVMINLDKADRYFDLVYALTEKTGTTRQIIMKGSSSPEKVQKLYGRYLDNIVYMPIVNLDKPQAAEHIERFTDELKPVAFELLYVSDDNPLPAQIPGIFESRARIWYNTLWDTMAGGHDDDASLEDPDQGYGYLIDSLGCTIIQTDRPQLLLDYLRSRGLHD